MKKVHQQTCSGCGNSKRCRHREFSPHAWAVLLHWEEIDSSVVGQAICNDCYNEWREMLIDRASEMEEIMQGAVASEHKMPEVSRIPSDEMMSSASQLAG